MAQSYGIKQHKISRVKKALKLTNRNTRLNVTHGRSVVCWTTKIMDGIQVGRQRALIQNCERYKMVKSY